MLEAVVELAIVFAVGALLVGQARDSRVLNWIAKPVASGCFVVLGVLRLTSAGAAGSYGGWILAGLVLGALGDVLLIEERTFDAGLVAFLAGHVAFCVACAAVLPVLQWSVAPLPPLAGLGFVVLRWLWPRLGRRKVAVTAYVVVIMVMVWAAAAVALAGARPAWLALAAVLFMASDIAVARHKFVRAQVLNRMLSLPAYYLAQVLFALSIGS